LLALCFFPIKLLDRFESLRPEIEFFSHPVAAGNNHGHQHQQRKIAFNQAQVP